MAIKDTVSYLAVVVLIGVGTAVALTVQRRRPAGGRKKDDATTTNNIAFLGNSMLYYNDCPRLVQCMLQMQSCGRQVHQDSCLRGGTNLTELWRKGNGMRHKFGIKDAGDIGAPTVSALLGDTTWDVVVLNDHTQGPARETTAALTRRTLQEQYRPLIIGAPLMVVLQTPAYRYPNMLNTHDLGAFDMFTAKVREGVASYAAVLHNSVVAPVGDAYQFLRISNPALFDRLYCADHFHPSSHGTWLEACTLVCSILRNRRNIEQIPPEPLFDCQAVLDTWEKAARYWQPNTTTAPELPNEEEAKELWRVAQAVVTRLDE